MAVQKENDGDGGGDGGGDSDSDDDVGGGDDGMMHIVTLQHDITFK